MFIILNDVPNTMELCEICPEPGHCCTGFVLDGGAFGFGWFVEEPDWRSKVQIALDLHGLPFVPLDITGFVDRGEDRVGVVRYTCPKLTTEGRCSIYDSRPNVCRLFEPMQDKLCVFKSLQSVAPEENHDRRSSKSSTGNDSTSSDGGNPASDRIVDHP